jgi:hemolysin III
LLLIVEWSLAVFGIIMKTVMIGRFQKLSTAAYLLMGWLVVLAWPTLTEALSFTTLVWVVVGGLSYTFGVVFFAWEKLYMNHAIWHVFVLGGSVCHYFAVLDVIKIAVA